MKITVTIYNDDKAGNRDISVSHVSKGVKCITSAVVEPSTPADPQCHQVDLAPGDFIIIVPSGT